MNINNLVEIVRRRLVRKAKQAEKAYIAELSVKSTCNCINHGIRLSENVYHCKINAMGSHESGASQCWDQKARLCPVFEKKSIDELRKLFRKMGPNEIAIRWPSLGELIRFEHLLTQLDEFKNEKNETPSQTGVRLRDDDQLSSSGEGGISPDRGDVRGGSTSGSSDETSSKKIGVNEGRKSDSGSSESGPDNKERLSLAVI